jgi:hypothetical protein
MISSLQAIPQTFFSFSQFDLFLTLAHISQTLEPRIIKCSAFVLLMNAHHLICNFCHLMLFEKNLIFKFPAFFFIGLPQTIKASRFVTYSSSTLCICTSRSYDLHKPSFSPIWFLAWPPGCQNQKHKKRYNSWTNEWIISKYPGFWFDLLFEGHRGLSSGGHLGIKTKCSYA